MYCCCCCCCCCCCIEPPTTFPDVSRPREPFPRCFLRVRIFFQKHFLFRYPKIANFDRPKRGHINEFLNSFFEMTQILRQNRAKNLQNFRKSGTPRAQKKKKCVHSASVRCAYFTTSLRVDRVIVAFRSEKESVQRRDRANFASARFFFNAPAKSSRSGRAKFLMNFIENH